MSRQVSARAAALTGVAIALSACYGYRPVGGAAPAPESELRVRLTDSGTVALRDYLGADVAAVSGRFRQRGERGLELAVETTESRAGAVHEWHGESVTIPAGLVATTETRRLSPLRTALAGGGLAAILVATGRAFSGAGGSRSGRRPPPGPQ